jgi:iron complex outermembrane receptor protein
MTRKTRRNAFRKATRVSRAAARNSTYTKLGLSGFTLGSMAVSSTLFGAEPADAPAAPASGPAELQEVVITGIRASLQKSLDIKEQSLGVVDAISAEDIGAFPDASASRA